MNIGAFLDRQHVIPGMSVADKPALLRALAERAAIIVKIDESIIAEALTAREQLGSTGMGNGLAIPHARIRGLSRLFGMFGRIEPPMSYAAIDGKPVDMVFLLLTPEDKSSAHLSALAAVSRRLRDPAVAVAIRRAENARQIYGLLVDEAIPQK
jgi:nitrogen PTS system EIIA component